MKMITTQRNGKSQRFLLRGDSEGYVTLWTVPEITIEEVKQIQDRNAIKCTQFYSFYIGQRCVEIENCLIFRPHTNHLYEFK